MEASFIFNTEIAMNIAKELLTIEAIKLSPKTPFLWASGWKSPIYCDNRLSLSFPKLRETITENLVQAINFQFEGVECIAGVATAGIPQGALIAAALNLPFVYVRSSAKGHGMTNLIEGKITKGQKVVVIEDLISTGGSSLKAVADLRENGFDVLGMAAIFTYGFDVATNNFNQAHCPLVCLSDYSHLITVANLPESDTKALKLWRENPSIWGK